MKASQPIQMAFNWEAGVKPRGPGARGDSLAARESIEHPMFDENMREEVVERRNMQAAPESRLREALTRLWSVRGAMRQAEGEQRLRLHHLVVLEQMVCGHLCAQWEVAYERVAAILHDTVRASSAVECVNSVVRMHQGRHRYMSQGMLDLKRLYWNCRVFREGKRKGRCPYDLLGLILPTYDWWQLLQMDPDELEQKLLTKNVTA